MADVSFFLITSKTPAINEMTGIFEFLTDKTLGLGLPEFVGNGLAIRRRPR